MEKGVETKNENSKALRILGSLQQGQTKLHVFAEKSDAFIEKVEENVSKFIGVIGLFMLFPYILLKLVETYIRFQFVFYLSTALCFAMFIWLLWWILSKRFYSIADTKLPTDIYVPLAVIICASWLAMTCFGALTSALYDAGLFQLTPAPQKHNFAKFADFYFWYGIDLIPELDINETFHRKVPFEYSSNKVALLLLFFKVIIVVVIIKQIYSWNEWTKEVKKGQKAVVEQ